MPRRLDLGLRLRRLFVFQAPLRHEVDLDLTQHDQRRALHCLWTLAEHEKLEHLTKVVDGRGMLLLVARW